LTGTHVTVVHLAGQQHPQSKLVADGRLNKKTQWAAPS